MVRREVRTRRGGSLRGVYESCCLVACIFGILCTSPFRYLFCDVGRHDAWCSGEGGTVDVEHRIKKGEAIVYKIGCGGTHVKPSKVRGNNFYIWNEVPSRQFACNRHQEP